MKRILIILLIVLTIGALSILGYQFFPKKQSQPETGFIQPVSSQADINKKASIQNMVFKIEDTIPDTPMNYAQYLIYLNSLDKKDVNSIQKGLKAFKRNQLNFSQVEKDQAFVDHYQKFFNEVIKEFKVKVEDSDLAHWLENENTNSEWVDLNEVLVLLNDRNRPKKDPQIQALAELMYYNGLKFNMSEGFFFITAQPDFLFINSQLYLSNAYQEYLAIKMRGDAKGCMDGWGLGFSYDELGNEIITLENFLKNYPDFKFTNDLRNSYYWYLSLFLRGINGYNPVFNDHDQHIDLKVKTVYESFIEKNSESESGELVKKFYELLKTEGFKKSDKIEEFYAENQLKL